MNTKEMIEGLKQLLENPTLTERERLALEETCEALKEDNTLEAIEKIAQLLAALAGLASYIQHMTS